MSLLRLRGLGLVAIIVAQVAVAPGSASAAPVAATATPATGPPATVTLITGDKVTATPTAAGLRNPEVRDARGRPTGFLQHRDGDDTYVYPHDALPYLASGLVDKELFNIDTLVEDGYDDKHSARLPLIVTYTAAARQRTAAAPRGATGVRPLDSIQGAALSADRTGAFWSSVTTSATAGSARSGSGIAGSGSGIAKIWLDGKAEVSLAESTAQIGAPEVWKTGNTGAGVDVAVLDTGIDTAHPDVAGQIAATESFVPGASVEDGAGHGTHVASTIAGTGAASDGRERGVAPGARLHIGKVLADDGFGQESWIISGMEWATRDQHARIVNLSLGADPTDGTDPMSLAVNRLSAETGALFVISAGNSGPAAYTVGTPGAADAALTVGAVGPDDLLTFFSSQGPRAGDRAVKPELTAPGANILAARSQYAPEGEGPYLTMSGTSMAAPHVAGAAALLAAQHPGLTGPQLKDALVSTTKPTPDVTPYEGGSGRLDVAAAAAATVFGTGVVNFGYPAYPTAPDGPVDREIRYTNTGDEAVTLDLAIEGTDVVALSAKQVTVPANGVATVTASIEFDRVPADRLHSGFVTASAAGRKDIRTSLGVGREGVRHLLSLKAKDRSGKPTGGQLVLLGKGTSRTEQIDAGGTLNLRLPGGEYTAWLSTDVEGAHGPSSRGLALLPVPVIELDRDRTVVFDAAKAKPAGATTPQPAAVTASRYQVVRDFGQGSWTDAWHPGAEYDSVWVLPTTRKVAEGTFAFGARWRLTQPALTVESGGEAYDDVRVQRARTPLPRGRGRLDAVLGGDARGKALVVRRSDTVPLEEQAAAAAASGASLLLVVNDGTGRLEPWPGSVWTPVDAPPVTVATLTRDEGERLIGRIQRERRVRLALNSRPATEYVYDLVHDYPARMPADLTHRATPQNLARINTSFRNWRPAHVIEGRSDVYGSLEYAVSPAIGDRVDWVTAGVPWFTELQIPGDQSQHNAPAVYPAGSVRTERWFGPVQRPRLVEDDDSTPVFRQEGGWFFAFVPGWGDSGAAHEGGTFDNFAADNTLRLYQGDRLVSQTDRHSPQLVAGPLPDERLPYRLVSENKRDTWAGPYSVDTRTEWSFTSSGVAVGAPVQVPALIQLDYAVDTDVAGKAARNAALTISALTLPNAGNAGAIRTVGLEVSYDDGATWQPAQLRQANRGWRTHLAAPASAQFVSLRTTARDAKGNAVDQRITRAFGLTSS
ncbi:S8 family serine peptidase [Actinoplanes sp. NBRC 103695]|uniref:S8 family serine peptidase n=1 Tax=Actinoplanes sp. NBRC 103695 TaxID=3032202 RepID=UPI0024A31D57|nr:S8 family serine peptidase [Actinoplanes sp. NBRC 103695]GLY93844.1 peptidase [Actinoplanes sp. NBRC 103695]